MKTQIFLEFPDEIMIHSRDTRLGVMMNVDENDMRELLANIVSQYDFVAGLRNEPEIKEILTRLYLKSNDADDRQDLSCLLAVLSNRSQREILNTIN